MVLSFCCGFEAFLFVELKAGLDAATPAYVGLSLSTCLLIATKLSIITE